MDTLPVDLLGVILDHLRRIKDTTHDVKSVSKAWKAAHDIATILNNEDSCMGLVVARNARTVTASYMMPGYVRNMPNIEALYLGFAPRPVMISGVLKSCPTEIRKAIIADLRSRGVGLTPKSTERQLTEACSIIYEFPPNLTHLSIENGDRLAPNIKFPESLTSMDLFNSNFPIPPSVKYLEIERGVDVVDASHNFTRVTCKYIGRWTASVGEMVLTLDHDDVLEMERTGVFGTIVKVHSLVVGYTPPTEVSPCWPAGLKKLTMFWTHCNEHTKFWMPDSVQDFAINCGYYSGSVALLNTQHVKNLVICGRKMPWKLMKSEWRLTSFSISGVYITPKFLRALAKITTLRHLTFHVFDITVSVMLSIPSTVESVHITTAIMPQNVRARPGVKLTVVCNHRRPSTRANP